jgi:hypothetical protein
MQVSLYLERRLNMSKDVIARVNEILKLNENKVVSRWNDSVTFDEFDSVYVQEDGNLIAALNEDDCIWYGEGYYRLNSDFSLGKKLGYASW